MKKNIAGLASRWKHKPETIIAPVTAGILGGILAKSILALAFSPSLITMFIGIVLSGVIVYSAFDRNFRRLIWAKYTQLIKSLVHRVVEIDPIDQLRDYKHHLFETIMEMTKQTAALNKQKAALELTIAENQEKIADLGNEVTQQQMSPERKAMKAQQMGRLAASNAKYTALREKMDILYRVLLDMYKKTEFSIEDISFQIEEKTQESEAIKASHSAMNAAAKIILGKSAERLQFDQAVDALADDVASKIGEMDQFLSQSSHILQTVDLQNEVQAQQGLLLLDQLVAKQQGLDLSTQPARQKEAVLSVPKVEDSYEKLFREM